MLTKSWRRLQTGPGMRIASETFMPHYTKHGFILMIRQHHAHAMKTRLIVAIALGTFPLTHAFSQALPQPPQISVSGSAEVKVAPDEVYLRVGVETRHENLDDAKHQNDERVSKALAFLKNNEVRDKDIQTDFISIEPTYDSDISRTKPVTYVVRKSIEIKLAKIQAFEGLLTGLLTNGVNHVHGIEFRTSQLRKHRDAARAMAIRAAKEKADALASELGVKKGKVYSINANDWGGWWSSSGSSWGGRGGGAMFQNAVQNAGGPSEVTDGTLSIGQISVSASVNVSFLIQ